MLRRRLKFEKLTASDITLTGWFKDVYVACKCDTNIWHMTYMWQKTKNPQQRYENYDVKSSHESLVGGTKTKILPCQILPSALENSQGMSEIQNYWQHP